MFCSHVRYVCLYVCMYVCTKSFLKTTTNSSCVCTHLANKADSDSDSDSQATGMTASLRIQSSKADSNTWESFTRSGLKLESVHQESPRSDIFRKRATKPLLNQRQCQKHLTWAVEKDNWTVAQ